MPSIARFGAVIYAKNLSTLARFYEQLVPMRVAHAEKDHVVLEAGEVQLVIHAIPKNIANGITIEQPPLAREETPIKLFFQIESLATIRRKAADLGGRLAPAAKEWEARGFRACDGVDPEGNVVQFREDAG